MCGHRFGVPLGFDPHAAYDDPTYAGFRPDPIFATRAADLWRTRVLPHLPRDGAVLDVGCGNGAFLRIARELGLSARGIDVSKAAVEHCRAASLDAEAGDFPAHDFGGERFAAVTFWDVLEHLPDPRTFVRRASQVLLPNGVLVAKVPGHKAVSALVGAWIPRLAGAVLQFPHHLQLFTRQSLETLVRPEFEILDLIEPGAMRGVATGGPLKRRLARRVVRTIHAASRDRGLLVVAQKRGDLS